MSLNIISPKPTKQNALLRLKNIIPISSVVDVGVRECTAELISCLGNVKHYLFEPVSTFYLDIEKNYANINHELIPLALSDQNSEIYLKQTCLNKDGVVTHSQISSDQVFVDGMTVVSCEPIQVCRYCDLDISNVIPNNYLLKIDVDGKDLEVVRGFGDKLNNASIVIIECTYNTLLERLGYIQGRGFQLFDIVDLVYYGAGMWQFDLVFIRPDLITSDVRPSIVDFQQNLWSPLAI
jgi:FkbM family methyltransferase